MGMNLQNKEGHAVPSVTLVLREGDRWIQQNTEALFKNKRVVLFALPGAFTPTCSSSHLPRYQELYPSFKASGVDQVICLSVNDAFVMDAWREQQKATDIFFLPDGNGTFTQAMGMLVDKSSLGFGMRSWRYSMVVQNGVIEKMFIEPEKPGDPFEVSDADTMLKYLAPQLADPESVMLFTKPGCPYCARAKELLEAHGLVFEEIVLGKGATVVSLKAITGQTTVPQIFIGGRHIGGSEDLARFLSTRDQ